MPPFACDSMKTMIVLESSKITSIYITLDIESTRAFQLLNKNMKNTSLDSASLKILAELQKNCRLSSNELAEKIGMSTSPCWRRQKELEDSGVIARYAAIVDRRKIGMLVCCMAHVTLQKHTEGVLENFEETVRLRPEVVECYETTGTADYMVKVIVQDMDAYHDFLHNVLFKLNGVSHVNTSVALREVKYETALPLT